MVVAIVKIAMLKLHTSTMMTSGLIFTKRRDETEVAHKCVEVECDVCTY